MVWIILGLFVLAYIIADAFFEVTAKLSGWWKLRARPVLRRVWGAVVGRRTLRSQAATSNAAPAASAPPKAASNAPEAASLAPDAVPSPATGPHQGPVRALSVPAVLSFLWKAKWAILIAVIFVSGVALMRGCTPIWAKSRDTLRAELKEARITETVTAHEAGVATKAIELAEETHRDRDRVRVVIEQTNEELTDAVEASDFDRLYDAYERGTHGVFFDLERADSPNPAPPGVAPVRGPRADAA